MLRDLPLLPAGLAGLGFKPSALTMRMEGASISRPVADCVVVVGRLSVDGLKPKVAECGLVKGFVGHELHRSAHPVDATMTDQYQEIQKCAIEKCLND
jgi:hypothetical protein